MNIFIIVLQVMLGSVFLLSGFLAVRRHKTDWPETFPTTWAPLAGGAMLLTSQQLREKCFEVALQRHQATYEKNLPGSSSDGIEIPFSHSLFRRKDMTMMNTHFDSQKQGEMAADTETFATDLMKLAGYGFTSEEIVSLLWLRQWYQAGGSDRVELVRHWEFLKLLVLNDKLDV